MTYPVSVMKRTVAAKQIEALAKRTRNAYSYDRYASWKACAAALLRRGYDGHVAEVILRSILTRWGADYPAAPYGRATSQDLLRCLDRNKRSLDEILRQEGAA